MTQRRRPAWRVLAVSRQMRALHRSEVHARGGDAGGLYGDVGVLRFLYTEGA